jgi:predicted Zn finger-like uncharacterized protein
MIWIVRCPECGTIYKLVPDQLKIAQAWLRCGQCQHAFDSTGLVVAWPAANLEPNGVTDLPAEAERLVIDDLLKQEDKSKPDAQSVTTVSAFEEALASFKPQPLSSMTTERLDLNAAADGLYQQGAAQTEQRGRQASSAWTLKLAVLFLSLVLALQWVWIERHALAAAEPGIAKVLRAVCQTWGCEISAPPVRDGMVIEHSSLTPREEGGFLLRWSWRNATSQALETPALELTLVNAQDKVLARRVIFVTDLQAPASLAANQTWDGQLQIMTGDDLTPLGYRLLSFYP